METTLIEWALGIVVVVLSGAWGRLASKVVKNGELTAAQGEEVAELRGQMAAMREFHGELTTEIRNVHQRIGGVAQTANTIAGRLDGVTSQLTGLNSSVTLITEHLLQGKDSS